MNNNKIITYLELHLFELKCNFFIFLITFFYLFSICFYFSNQLIYLFVKILIKSNMLKYFIFTNITEMLLTSINISIFISLFIAIQLLIIQFWFFISSGLYQYENYKIMKFYILFIIFNIFIISIILIKMIPNIWFFFINNEFSNKYLFNIYFEPQFNNYFYFLFSSSFYIYVIFVYFFILFFIIFNTFFKIKTIINLRKFFYFKFLLISILISPPDFINQLIILLIFFIIFEVFIFIYIYLYRYFFNKI